MEQWPAAWPKSAFQPAWSLHLMVHLNGGFTGKDRLSWSVLEIKPKSLRSKMVGQAAIPVSWDPVRWTQHLS